MIYACIQCHKIWKPAAEPDELDSSTLDLETSTEISHGICPECFRQHEDRVHRHQKNNGYSECYNRNDNCSNIKCLFKPACGESAIRAWKSGIVVLSPSN